MAYPDDRKYTNDHEWIRMAGDTAEVGVTDYAQKQLGEVVYVELPEVGAKVTAAQPFGSIESVKAVSELFAPMSGEVLEVNTQLRDHPEQINAHPHAAWMIKMRVANSAEGGALLDSSQYQALIG